MWLFIVWIVASIINKTLSLPPLMLIYIFRARIIFSSSAFWHLKYFARKSVTICHCNNEINQISTFQFSPRLILHRIQYRRIYNKNDEMAHEKVNEVERCD